MERREFVTLPGGISAGLRADPLAGVKWAVQSLGGQSPEEVDLFAAAIEQAVWKGI
jgi:hypothetical protein